MTRLRKNRRRFAVASLALVMTLLAASASPAQTLGYISADLNNAIPTLASFNSSTGVIASPFPGGLGGGHTFAVSSDGSTIYLPGIVDATFVLNIVSAATGQILQSVPLAHPATKVLLSGNGARAYVLTGIGESAFAVEVVDLTTGAVKGAIAIPGGGIRSLVDIALSPNDSQLFLALGCLQECPAFPTPCTVAKGICVFNALTLAFESEVAQLSGYLSISQDGNSLYVALNEAPNVLYVLNTQTMTIGYIAMGGFVSGPPVVSPVGKYAIEFTDFETSPSGAEAYILDTQTNAIVRKLFLTFPGGSSATSEFQDFLGNQATFASDGNSIWVDLFCTAGTGCTLPNGATQALAGFEFPSGKIISETVLTTVPLLGLGTDNVSLAFPHVLTAKQ